MRSSKRYRQTVIGLLITILLGLEGTSLPASARQNAQGLYESGKNCQSQLLASPKKQKYRVNWERCIKPFDQLRMRYPKNSYLDDSLFHLGKLYGGLYRYSGNPKDLALSKASYQNLIKSYPSTQLARQAQSRLNTLTPPTRTMVKPQVVIENIRHWAYPDYIRLVLDLSRPVQYRQAQDKDPAALRLILADTQLGRQAQAQLPSLNTDLLRWVSFKSSSPTDLEVIIPVEGLIGTPKIMPLSNPERLVIDLFRRPSSTAKPPSPQTAPSGPGTALAQSIPLTIQRIVIDPGHGGKDPGAIGRGGLTEKEVVLEIGLRLRKLIEERLGKTVIMTREKDTFIELDDRTLLANSKKADLFVSIHANAHPNRSTRGVEIYLLGPSSNKRALAVAARENSVSLESIGNLDRTLQQILFDLGRDYKINQSLEFAHTTRQSFMTTLKGRYNYAVVDLGVKRAPFYVLLNSNMPSILAEVSFISNPKEEQLLRKDRYRQAMAEALFEGLKRYIASIETTS